MKACDYQLENLLSAALICSGQVLWRQQEGMGLPQEDMGWTTSFFDVCSVCLYLAEGKDSTAKMQRLLRRQRERLL